MIWAWQSLPFGAAALEQVRTCQLHRRPLLHPCLEVPGATNVRITSNELTIHLADGRCITGPLVWYPRLVHATAGERNNWELHADNQHIHWPDLDEDISVEGLLAGRHSQESPASLTRCLAARWSGRGVTPHEICCGSG